MDQPTNFQINAVYKRFSEAYAHLDADGIAATFAESGVEVYLITDIPPAIISGRRAIRDEIKNFFKHVRNRGHRLIVTFRIVHREIHDRQAFDTGFYHVSIWQGDEAIQSRYGKVAIVLQRISDGIWEYLYDGNGSATQEKFERAVPIQNEGVA